MYLSSDIVVDAYRFLRGIAIEQEDADAMARKLGSVEEFLAQLLLEEGDRSVYLAMEDRLVEAIEAVGQARTPRVENADIAGTAVARRRVRDALLALIEADKARSHLASEAAVSFGEVAVRSLPDRRHPGLRWRARPV